PRLFHRRPLAGAVADRCCGSLAVRELARFRFFSAAGRAIAMGHAAQTDCVSSVGLSASRPRGTNAKPTSRPITPALAGGNGGDVAAPHLIGLGDVKRVVNRLGAGAAVGSACVVMLRER